MGTAQTQSAGWQGSTVQGKEDGGIPYQPMDLNMLSLMLLAAQGVLATSVWKHSAADVVKRNTATCGSYLFVCLKYVFRKRNNSNTTNKIVFC